MTLIKTEVTEGLLVRPPDNSAKTSTRSSFEVKNVHGEPSEYLIQNITSAECPANPTLVDAPAVLSTFFSNVEENDANDFKVSFPLKSIPQENPAFKKKLKKKRCSTHTNLFRIKTHSENKKRIEITLANDKLTLVEGKARSLSMPRAHFVKKCIDSYFTQEAQESKKIADLQQENTKLRNRCNKYKKQLKYYQNAEEALVKEQERNDRLKEELSRMQPGTARGRSQLN